MKHLITLFLLAGTSYYSLADIVPYNRQAKEILFFITNMDQWPDHHILYSLSKNGEADTLYPDNKVVLNVGSPGALKVYIWAVHKQNGTTTKKEMITPPDDPHLKLRIESISDKYIKYSIHLTPTRGSFLQDNIPKDRLFGLAGISMSALLLITVMVKHKKSG